MSNVEEKNEMSDGALYTFRLIAGCHQGNKKRYKKGEYIRSHHPLDEMFQGKFQRMPNVPAVIDDGPDSLQGGMSGNARPASSPDKIRDVVPFSFSESSNVSHLFPETKATGLVVYKDSLGGYAVAEKDSKVMTNIAGEVLGSKKKVTEFLADFMPSNEPD